MKRFSAQYVFTNSGLPLKRAVITAEDDGTILNIENSAIELKESQSVEFYNGIIIPGFVNCHCHLELSHLKGAIAEGKGLSDFIMNVRSQRDYNPNEIISAAQTADDDLYKEGTELCADICNTSIIFNIKKKSHIRYINMLEVFGIDPEKAGKRIKEVISLSEEAEKAGMKWSLVPHSVYSLSLPLFRLLNARTRNNDVTSIHFMESESEAAFLKDHSGPLIKSYQDSGLLPATLRTPENHVTAIIKEVTQSGNLILVHNTFTDKNTIDQINRRRKTFWCLCPGSNLYIEKKFPPLELLISEKCNIVIGTDSLSSNRKLSILSELKIIQEHFPEVTLADLIKWATINGAAALNEEKRYGTIEPGKKPGLILLQDVDLSNLKLLPETTVTRLL